MAKDAVAEPQEPGHDGLVHRKAIATVPVTVEYSITDLGCTLSVTVDALRLWAEIHIEDVLAS